MDDTGTMSCAEMGQDVMHDPLTHSISNFLAGPLGVATTMEYGPQAGAWTSAATVAAGPQIAGTVTYLACLPAEWGSEYGHAIGTSLHDYFWGAPAAPEPATVPADTSSWDIGANSFAPSWQDSAAPPSATQDAFAAASGPSGFGSFSGPSSVDAFDTGSFSTPASAPAPADAFAASAGPSNFGSFSSSSSVASFDTGASSSGGHDSGSGSGCHDAGSHDSGGTSSSSSVGTGL